MIELRRVALCLPLVFVLPLVGGCDDGGEEDSNAAEEQGESETTAGEESGETGEMGDGDGDAETDGDPVACDLFESATPQAIVAAASASEAATAALVPDGNTVYEITLPEGAAGFVELQIADWDTMQAFYTNADIDYTVTTDANAQEPGPREPLSACPDAGVTSQSIFFPHWTPATLEFSATGPREIQLVIIQES